MTEAGGNSTIEVPIRQQDGSTVTLRYPDTVHNRLFAEFVRQQEPFNHVHCPASPNVRSSASARSAPIGRADERCA
jgi:hypothetical protein